MRSILMMWLVALSVCLVSPVAADPGTSGGDTKAEEVPEGLPPELLEKAREGARLVLQKRYDEAEAVLNEVTKKAPDYEQGQVNLAVLYERTKREAEALKLLTALVDKPAKTERPYLQLAALHQTQKRRDEAVKVLSTAVERFPKDANFLVQRAQLQSKVDSEKAKADYAKALEIDPRNRMALNNLSVLLMNENNYSKARPLLEKYVEVVSKGASGRFNLASVYYSLGEVDKGQALYKELLKQRPEDAFAISQLALGHLLKTPANLAEASKVLEPLSKSDSPHIAYGLGMVELFKGNAKGALPHLSRALEKGKGQTYFELAEAEALRQAGRHDDALNRLKSMAAEQQSARSFVLVYQGATQVSKGQVEQGRKLIQEGVAMQPTYSGPGDLVHLMRLPPAGVEVIKEALTPPAAPATTSSTTSSQGGGCGCAQVPPRSGPWAMAWLGLVGLVFGCSARRR